MRVKNLYTKLKLIILVLISFSLISAETKKSKQQLKSDVFTNKIAQKFGGCLPGPTGATGATGPKGNTGPKGATGTGGITTLKGDVTGPSNANKVKFVGGKSAASIAAATTSANSATSLNTPNTIVKRDGLGNFAATNITANLTGSASNNVLKSGDTMTGNLNLKCVFKMLPVEIM
jgi:hypothetical protein